MKFAFWSGTIHNVFVAFWRSWISRFGVFWFLLCFDVVRFGHAVLCFGNHAEGVLVHVWATFPNVAFCALPFKHLCLFVCMYVSM